MGFALVGVVLVLPVDVDAQAGGEGFLFRAPRVTLSLHGGFAQARVGSDVFDEFDNLLIFDRDEFARSFTFGGDVGVRATERLDLVFGVMYGRSGIQSEDSLYFDPGPTGNDSLPILQDTHLTRVPLTASLRFYLAPRGRTIGRFAWVPSTIVPYIGAGAGVMYHELKQEGDFVDYVDETIFSDIYRSSGWSPLAQVLGGFEVALGPRVALMAEGRYLWSSRTWTAISTASSPSTWLASRRRLGYHFGCDDVARVRRRSTVDRHLSIGLGGRPSMTSIDRVGIRFHNAGGLIGSLVACAMLVAPAQAQESADDAWFAWLGCWQAVGGPAGAVGDANDVCIAPSEGPVGIDLISVADGLVTDTRTLISDGAQRDVEQSGCSGWERSAWSADHQRVYLRSELDCEGGARRVTSGVIAMTSPTEWLEVQTIEAGGYPVVRAQRYRLAPASVAEAVGLSFPQDRMLALETARTAASEPMGIEDLAEASRELSQEALELYLYELGGTFDVNAESLVAMADAGVPESTIDLVVALAHPDVFNVNSEARMVGYRPDEPTPADVAEARDRGRTVYGRFYDPYYAYDPYFYGAYGSGYYGYSPFGWGGRYGWSTGPSIIVVEPRETEPQARGRFVKGRGYTRGGAATSETSSDRTSSRPARSRIDTSSPSSSRSRATTRSSSSGSSRARGSSGSSSSSGRKAKRKGGGGGGI